MLKLDSFELRAAIFEDFNNKLSEEVPLKLDEALLVQVFTATSIQEILFLPLVEVDLDVWREKVGKDLTTLIDAKEKGLLERVCLLILLI